MDKKNNKERVLEGINNTLGKKDSNKKNFVNYLNKVHINQLKNVVPDKLWNTLIMRIQIKLLKNLKYNLWFKWQYRKSGRGKRIWVQQI